MTHCCHFELDVCSFRSNTSLKAYAGGCLGFFKKNNERFNRSVGSLGRIALWFLRCYCDNDQNYNTGNLILHPHTSYRKLGVFFQNWYLSIKQIYICDFNLLNGSTATDDPPNSLQLRFHYECAQNIFDILLMLKKSNKILQLWSFH